MDQYKKTPEEPSGDPTEPRKGKGKISVDDLQAILQHVVEDAAAFNEEQEDDRAKATDYYHGRPFGNEEEGRSQVVAHEVKDTVKGVMPSLLRVIFGPEHPVEFAADHEGAVPTAQLATEVINYVFAEANPGFMRTQSVLKDGLIRRLGIYTWYIDDAEQVKVTRHSGLTEQEAFALMTDAGVEVLEDPEQDGEIEVPGEPGPDGQPTMQKVPTFRLVIERSKPRKRLVLDAVPPEEFLFSSDAKDLDDALLVGRRRNVPRGDLLAMGISEADLEEHGDADERLESSDDEDARNPDENVSDAVEAGEENDLVLYTEAYVYLDYYGRGRRELVKVCAIGTSYFPVEHYVCDHRPFAVFTPDPEPHTVLGMSMADDTMDLQLTKSAMLRSTLDSASGSIFPRPIFVEGAVAASDVLNTAIGSPIRVNKDYAQLGLPNVYQEMPVPFIAHQMLPLLEYVDGVKEQRTGQSRGAMGLDADALQSTTKAGVEAAVSGSQQQIEMLARNFAEQALKPMFRGLLRTIIEHPDVIKVARIRNQWIAVDPRSWNAEWDVSVNVMLGTGTVETKVAALFGIADRQAQILTELGPSNPITGLAQYRNTLARATELLGFKDTSRFFKPIDEQALEAQLAEQAKQPPPPTPEQIIAQAQVEIERMKAAKDAAIAEEKIGLEREKLKQEREAMLLQDDRERDKLAVETELKAKDIGLKYKQAVDVAEINAKAKATRESAAKKDSAA